MIKRYLLYLLGAILLFSVIITLTTLIFDDFDSQFYKEDRALYDQQQLALKESDLDREVANLLQLSGKKTGLVLFEENLDAFAIRVLLARAATRTLDLQYYIWHADITGMLLARELVKAADRGVKVRLLLDDLNSLDKDASLQALSEHKNISVRMFNPVQSRQNRITRMVEFLFRGLSLNRRMHNKAWIADGKLAVIGGRNIGDEYFDAGEETNFVDVDALLVGEAVEDTLEIFNDFWFSGVARPFKTLIKRRGYTLKDLRKSYEELSEEEQMRTKEYLDIVQHHPNIKRLLARQAEIYWSDNARVYSDPPEKVFDEREEEWLLPRFQKLWESAEAQLNFVSPYFIPGESGVALMRQLREESVAINVLTNSLAATDVPMVHSGYINYRQRLLEKGVKIYELRPETMVEVRLGKLGQKLNPGKIPKLGVQNKSLHTKIFTVDNDWSFIGSFNLDPRSAKLNTEMGLLVEDAIITARLKEHFEQKSASNRSFELYLEGGELRWLDINEAGEKRIWKDEPATGIFTRMMVKFLSYLPLESQL